MHACLQCLPVPAGFQPATLAADVPLVTSFAAALNTRATCSQYVHPGGQCGGSAGGCYGAQCAVRAGPVSTTPLHVNMAA